MLERNTRWRRYMLTTIGLLLYSLISVESSKVAFQLHLFYGSYSAVTLSMQSSIKLFFSSGIKLSLQSSIKLSFCKAI